MAPRIVRALGRAGLVLLLAAGAAVAWPATAAGASCPNPFPASFATDLAQRYPGIKVTAAVHDTASGCWFHLNPGMRITTASVIKAQVLGAVLLKAQDAGRGLTAWERSKIDPMIRFSFNTETSALYDHVGNTAGMHATDARLGASSTIHTRPFGLTSSTALDRTQVALRLLHGGGDLRQAGREEAWAYMRDVHPLQRWGITAGVPVGWTVALKNGFYPRDALGWRVGSTGFVRRDDADQGYAITVMTEGATTQATGIRLVEEVARRAAATLTVGPGAPRPIDRARCVTTVSGEAWTSVAARLGLPSSRAGEVRTIAGGDPAALHAMRVCSPDIPPEPVSSESGVSGYYRPAAADLVCDGRDDLLWYGPGGAADSIWAGHPDRTFRRRTAGAGGDLIPVPGDFDGDGCGDVLWYGPGTRADSIWYGGATVTARALSVQGTGYWPTSGDFDGDGRDDIFWYGPGVAADSIWFGSPARGGFSARATSVAGAYQPVAGDFDGDGADDVLWYGPGAAADSVWTGRIGERGTFDKRGASVNGRYRPAVADLDGDAADEIVWYGPGATGDARWDGLPPSQVATSLSVRGDHYVPRTGDFDGDGRDDIAWYGPGGTADSMWWSGLGGAPTAGPLRAR